MFCGFMIVSQGVAMLPVIADHRGLRMLALSIGLAAAATVIVLRFTGREQEGFSVHSRN